MWTWYCFVSVITWIRSVFVSSLYVLYYKTCGYYLYRINCCFQADVVVIWVHLIWYLACSTMSSSDISSWDWLFYKSEKRTLFSNVCGIVWLVCISICESCVSGDNCISVCICFMFKKWYIYIHIYEYIFDNYIYNTQHTFIIPRNVV